MVKLAGEGENEAREEKEVVSPGLEEDRSPPTPASAWAALAVHQCSEAPFCRAEAVSFL